MKCPKCQFENPEGVKFCGECGAKLERLCPKCNSANPAQFKFCGECGHNLTLPSEPTLKELSFDEKLKKIQKYLPKGITEKILSQRDRIEGEKKLVTVMFCDMEGFTSLSEKLGPEEMYTLMDEVYEILIHKVHDYDGTVNEMTGDGVMALFGAPIALEDAPQRAIRSALAIHREMNKFSEQVKSEKKIPSLKMRIGIHTGPVVVGTLGNDLRVEFKAVGDTVNLASRMEGLADPGTTYVTEDTFNLTEGLFRFEALGERLVKGKELPVRVYQVIAPSTRRTRFDVSAERGLTPFVGRERELEYLLDGFERAKGGRGQAFSLVAEAGLGKSRLLYEFRKAVSNEDAIFLEGKCLSYSRSVAYHPIIDSLKSNFDIRDDDGDLEITEKVKRGLKTLGMDEVSILPYLLELLSVKDSGIDKIVISPEARRDRIMEALKQIVLSGSEIRPLILAYEDLHWLDKSSEEVIKYVLDSIPRARVLMIFTYRPQFVHTWGAKSYHSQITLNMLSNRESLSMVSQILGAEAVNTDLSDLILEKTEGVPFFIEEFVKSLKDLGIIWNKDGEYRLAKDIHELNIPSTIQDVIMARVDSLPEDAKEVLQIGSVIEREFTHDLIKKVTALPEEKLLSHLSLLKDLELIYERGIYPQSAYVFKHALTREIIYDSIFTRRRKQLHEQIGNAIETFYQGSLEENYEVLVEHFIKGENYEKGARYSKLGGAKADKAGSINATIDFAKKRISCLEKLPLTESVQQNLIDIRTILGSRMLDMNHYYEAKEAIDPILKSATIQSASKRASQIYTIMAACDYSIKEDFARAFAHFDKALELARNLNDKPSEATAAYWYGMGLSLNCEFEKAVYHLQKTLSFNSTINHLPRMSALKGLLGYVGYFYQGKIHKAYEASYEGLGMAEQSGDAWSKALNYCCHGVSCYGKGFLQEAIDHLSRGYDLAEKIDQRYCKPAARYFLGEIYFDLGEYEKAEDHLRNAIRHWEEYKYFPSFLRASKLALARALAIKTRGDEDLSVLPDDGSLYKAKQFDGIMKKYRAELLLYLGNKNISDAEAWIKRAIEADKSNGMKWHLGRDFVFYSQVLKSKGNLSEAKDTLELAIDLFKECGAEGWVVKYRKELDLLQ